MSETTSPAEPYVCPHCNQTHEHTHADPRQLVLDYHKRLLSTSIARIVVVVAAVVAVAASLPVTAVLLLLALGALGWLVASIVGLVSASVDANRHGDSQSAPRAARSRFVTFSVLAGAAATPLVAFVIALIARAQVVADTTGDRIALAAAAGAGWLVVSGVVEVIRALTMRKLLRQETRPGEGAREAVVAMNGRGGGWREVIMMIATALAVALWTLGCLFLPILVFIFVPLHVALAALTRRQLDPQRVAS